MSELSNLGLKGTLYLGPGSMLCGLIYWSLSPLIKNLSHKSLNQESDYGATDYQLMRDGPPDMSYVEEFSFLQKLIKFTNFSLVYLGTQISIVLAFSFSL
jgi:hypothetical protein